MFADISGSTQFYVNLGDVRARDIIARCIDVMTEAERRLCRQIDLAQVKGKLEPVSIFELLWRSDGDATLMLAPWTTRRRPVGKLILIVDNQWCELSETHPSATIGRAEENDLVLRSPVISRLHARIEFRNGRFVFSDMSANGTYIASTDGAVNFLLRESQELTGTGSLALGDPEGPPIKFCIHIAQ
jgi:adenylate cyclase